MQKEAAWDTLGNEDLARLAVDMFHRLLVHHALWFREVEHQMGRQEAFQALDTVYRKSLAAQMQRLSKLFGFEVENGLPKPLLSLPREKLLELITAASVNWLANDGIWFQAVEFQHGMFDAKRCNDSCWAKFSPFEAWSVKRYLGLPEKPGLAGLKQALQFRMYAGINEQSMIEESPNSLVFQMNNCRVQSARKRRGLEDYPCKSAGLVEYPQFARAIDPGIKTECIGCPPDAHPEAWFCAWRFTLAEGAPA